MLGSFVCLYVFLFVSFVLFCFVFSDFCRKIPLNLLQGLDKFPKFFTCKAINASYYFLPFYLVENTVSTHEDEKVKESLPFEDPVCITLEYFRSV